MKKVNAALSLSGRPRQASGVRTWAVLGGLAGWVLALLVMAPAYWLSEWVQSQLGGQVLLVDARGTVWQGSARLTLKGEAGTADSATLPGRIQWSITPGLSGFQLALQAPCCTKQALVALLQLQWQGALVKFSDGQSQWPMALLSGLGTPWNTLHPQGHMIASFRSLEAHWNMGRLTLAGQAEIEVRGLSSNLSPLRPMGSYRLRLQGGDSPSLSLETIEGKLQLDGRGQWVGNRLRFSGEARAEPGHEAALANLLNIIGRRDGSRTLITLG